MKIKVFKWNEEAMDYQLVDDELKIGDGVTLNYYSDEEPAIYKYKKKENKLK